MTQEKIHGILKKLNGQIVDLNRQIKQYPSGHLLSARNGKYFKHFCYYQGKNKYIPKKNYDMALRLAQKKYMQSKLEDLLFEKKAMEKMLETYKCYYSHEELLLNSPIYRDVVAEAFKRQLVELDNSSNVLTWLNAEYERNISHPDQLNQKCLSGHVVRSKSESMIDQALFSHQIPFRYECVFQANGIKLYPDFTIMHPQTWEIYYWEHFGMMDVPNYAQNAFQKMKLYNSCGIIPSINLIMTFETQDHPLSTDLIEEIIEHYFL